MWLCYASMIELMVSIDYLLDSIQARHWVYKIYECNQMINGGNTQVNRSSSTTHRPHFKLGRLKALHKPNKLPQPTLQLLSPWADSSVLHIRRTLKQELEEQLFLMLVTP